MAHSRKKAKGWEIWIDRGGTFTDLVAKRPDGRIVTHKLLSDNPEKYQDSAIFGIRELLRISSSSKIPVSKISSIKIGTTIATNALIERKGERTFLLTTKGFKDALRIGYQNRPKLFDRHIKLEQLLYERVAEVSERISATGEIVSPLNEQETRNVLKEAYSLGFRSVAIVFMHAFNYPAHENRAEEIAKGIGFTQISTSNKTSPLIKFIPRGDTTVIDAYLSPTLQNYVKRISKDLSIKANAQPKLMFMQSNGGLTKFQHFKGKNAILSGPAGGVVGMVRTAELEGFSHVIGFDMGGTSTDVSHYDGQLERVYETIISGVRVRTPMMKIHTIAAGGGSILHFDGERFRVGPDSAGANPGPASYRRNGPLTVTDCNVMLGKIQADFFPALFGPGSNQRLDVKVVRKKFLKMAQKISSGNKEKVLEPEEVAEGFLRVAVENMANAIKKISVQQGHDVTRYTLNCFGGAGGQHACLVADALGIKQILLHPFAGMLSAYGIGLADVRVIREKSIEALLKPGIKLNQEINKLKDDAEKAVKEQGVFPENITVENKVHIRYQGTDNAIVVPFNTPKKMKKTFEQKHQKQFGFINENKEIVLESLSVEAIGIEKEIPALSKAKTNTVCHETFTVPIYCNGTWQNASMAHRSTLKQSLDGPAIILDNGATVIVEPGWSAQLTPRQSIILKRVVSRPTFQAVEAKVNPVMLEIFNNLFMSIAEQMGTTLANTAHSINIKERLDFSCALFDQDGNLIANAPHMPVHIGSMGNSIQSVIKKNKGQVKAGNVYALNAPYNGGTHLPDITIVTPVFDDSKATILFYVGSRGHHADIGGITPGSMPPNSKSVEEEGILIDNFLLVENGVFRENAIVKRLSSGPHPARNIKQNIADLQAQVAANETGVRELRKLAKNFGINVVHNYMKFVQDNAEKCIRNALDSLRSGKFKYIMDTGSKIEVDVKINKNKRCATIDFTGTSTQTSNNFNAPSSICTAAVLYVFRTLIDEDIPLNAGCLKPLNIIIPNGCMLKPVYPAAVVAGNVETSQCITDAIYGALGVLASSQGTMNNLTLGNNEYQYYETICGGSGAGPNFDGTDAVHTHMTNSRLTDPEILEIRMPLRVEEFQIRQGSGGHGKYIGGNGTIRKLRALEPMTAAILSLHRKFAPFGLNGGKPGKRGHNWVKKINGSVTKLKGTDQLNLDVGDVIVIETPGGGGFGHKAQKKSL